LLLGIGSSGLGQLIGASQAILLVPLFLHSWGSNGYGQWIALTAMISYLGLLDLGGQSYLGNLLTIDYAKDDLKGFTKKLSEGVSFFSFLSAGVVILLAALLFGLPLATGQALENMLPGHNNAWAILALAGSVLLAIPAGVYVTTYRATGLFARGMMVGNLLRFVELVFYIAMLVLKVPAEAYAAGLLAAAVFRTFFIILDSRRHIPVSREIKINLGLAWQGRTYLKGSLQFWILALATTLNQQAVLIIITAVINPLAVVTYATHRTAAGIIGYISSFVQAPLAPELSVLWARQRQKDLQEAVLLSVKFVLLASLLAGLFLWVSLPVIYPFWTGKTLNFDPLLLGIFIFQMVLASAWSTLGWPLLATNNQKAPAFWTTANALLTIILAVILAPGFGVLGVACATLLGDIICGFAVYPALCARILSLPLRTIYQAIFAVCIAVLPLFLVIICGGALAGNPLTFAVLLALSLAWCLPGLRLALGPTGLSSLRRVFNLARFSRKAGSVNKS
jgi:O-antigen/teichoic acid export membrane protein